VVLIWAALPAFAQKPPANEADSAGEATFTGNCPGEVRYVGVCLGPNGRQGYQSLALNPRQQRTIAVPNNSTYDALCGQRPRRQCPGEFAVEFD
jgi:hypothetical protein